METLVQRKLHSKKMFHISERSLHYRFSNLWNSNEVEIKYEDLGKNVMSGHRARRWWLFVGLALLVAAGLWLTIPAAVSFPTEAKLVTMLLGVCCLGAYYLTYQRFYKIQLINGRYLYFFQDAPDREAVEIFLTELLAVRDNYLEETYGYLNRNLDYSTQYDNFLLLYKLEVWTKHRFDRQVAQLDEMYGLDRILRHFGGNSEN